MTNAIRIAVIAIAGLAAVFASSSRPAHGDLDLDGKVSYPVIALTVGGSYLRSTVGGSCICDDYGIVHVDLNEDGHLRLTGIKPGKTLCGFATGARYGLRKAYSVEVSDPR